MLNIRNSFCRNLLRVFVTACVGAYLSASFASEVKTADFFGKWYEPTQSSRSTAAILLIGGSEGGLLMADTVAPQFAALGYPVLGVNYHGGFADRSRPLANVPIEQFIAAAKWLRVSRGAKHVVVIGESRGSEAALLTALQTDAVSAVVAVVPSVYVWSAVGSDDPNGPSAWMIAGKPLTFVKPIKEERPDANTFMKAIASDNDFMTALIAVEKIKVPVLMIAGDDDAVWPAAHFVRMAQRRVALAKTPSQLEAHIYPNAGHRLLGIGSASPTETYAWQGGEFVARYGGTEHGNARARAAAWLRIVSLLERVGR